MNFSVGGMYHIYNQGNNRQLIFFNRENYIYFLQKIRIHLLPYADLLAYCLMPNHFHLMVEVISNREMALRDSRGATLSRTPTDEVDFNHSIGIMLASYTRAINNQEKTSGSLFRQKTKAICLNELHGVSSDWYMQYGVTYFKQSIPEWQYPQVCFNYIHNNPVVAGLVRKPQDWEFSSWQDYAGIREGDLVNKAKAKEYGLKIDSPR